MTEDYFTYYQRCKSKSCNFYGSFAFFYFYNGKGDKNDYIHSYVKNKE